MVDPVRLQICRGDLTLLPKGIGFSAVFYVLFGSELLAHSLVTHIKAERWRQEASIEFIYLLYLSIFKQVPVPKAHSFFFGMGAGAGVLP